MNIIRKFFNNIHVPFLFLKFIKKFINFFILNYLQWTFYFR